MFQCCQNWSLAREAVTALLPEASLAWAAPGAVTRKGALCLGKSLPPCLNTHAAPHPALSPAEAVGCLQLSAWQLSWKVGVEV